MRRRARLPLPFRAGPIGMTRPLRAVLATRSGISCGPRPLTWINRQGSMRV